ncbi:hypothetical protein STPYR_10397 [uncultured Stenotrophomonas sp.]|uniref:Uncharacterized protein n=1 Tax=uncultured Stenotrophomonas sp. TaxID=165438 RepID=A0A1Y5Q6T5_9GAMM|nr:hypothetical protein STPYR_10397 [uncultured Stenotrophomonas sp.]
MTALTTEATDDPFPCLHIENMHLFHTCPPVESGSVGKSDAQG